MAVHTSSRYRNFEGCFPVASKKKRIMKLCIEGNTNSFVAADEKIELTKNEVCDSPNKYKNGNVDNLEDFKTSTTSISL